jgi:ABC-2 type transport system ATP-binding protein
LALQQLRSCEQFPSRPFGGAGQFWPNAKDRMSAVATHNLTKIYGERHVALNGVSMTVESGTALGLVGPNGAGKTTLLRLILGLHRPSAGWVEVFGRPMTANTGRLRRRIGYLPAAPRFPPDMTAIGYLDFVGKLCGLAADVRRPRVAAVARAVDLLGAAAQPIAALSTGMRTRLGIAASLVNEPELVVWDEPTAGLDPEARRFAVDLMKQLARDRTLILSSHAMRDVENVCDRVLVLAGGNLIFQGTVAELKGRMRRNRYEIQLDAKPKAIEALRASLAKLSTVRSATTNGQRVELELADGKDTAGPLAEVMMTVSESGVSLVGVRTLGSQTEEAFLELVEADQARGFSRATERQAA